MDSVENCIEMFEDIMTDGPASTSATFSQCRFGDVALRIQRKTDSYVLNNNVWIEGGYAGLQGGSAGLLCVVARRRRLNPKLVSVEVKPEYVSVVSVCRRDVELFIVCQSKRQR